MYRKDLEISHTFFLQFLFKSYSPQGKILILNISHEHSFHVPCNYSICKVATFQITYSSCNLKKSNCAERPLVRESHKQHKDPDNFHKIMKIFYLCLFIIFEKIKQQLLLEVVLWIKQFVLLFGRQSLLWGRQCCVTSSNNSCKRHYQSCT